MSYTDLLSSTPKYEFKGIQDCLQIFDQSGEQDEGNPYIIFVIDERSFLDCFENSDERLLRKSWEFYDPSINHLLVKTMESGVHAVTIGAFTQMFLEWSGPFDPNYPLLTTTTQIFRGRSGQKKRADCSWTPAHSGLDRKWPTIAVEVAWSEPRGKLDRDTRFWLTQSSEVNIVLAIQVHARGSITMRLWELRRRTPIVVQKLEIQRNPPPDCEKIQGSMRIPFEKIHLRPKGPNDTDFIISHADMHNLASQVWIKQFHQSA